MKAIKFVDSKTLYLAFETILSSLKPYLNIYGYTVSLTVVYVQYNHTVISQCAVCNDYFVFLTPKLNLNILLKGCLSVESISLEYK